MKTLFFIFVILLTIPSTALSDGPFNYGRYWDSLSPAGKLAYLEGYYDATCKIVSESVMFHRKKKSEPINTQFLAKMTRDIGIMTVDRMVLSNVISSLYGDPANTYIAISRMIPIARDKIVGVSIDNELLFQRKMAQDEYKIMQKMRDEGKLK